jgi:hypothetical protein
MLKKKQKKNLWTKDCVKLQSDALPLSYDNLKLLRASSQLKWRCLIRKSMLAKRQENKVWQGSFDLV